MSFAPLSSLKAKLDDIYEVLSRLGALASVLGILSDIRVTPTGTVTVAGSLTTAGTVSTVTTVTTLNNQTLIGGVSATNQVPSLMNIEASIANIDNIIIS